MTGSPYTSLLSPGETLVERPAPEHKSLEAAYGYQTLEIENSTHLLGNSVLLEVQPKGAVEPVAIIKWITLSVRTLQGQGYAVIENNFSQHVKELVLLKPEADPIDLELGHAYYYLNCGTENLILRDDATPAFHGNEEISLTGKPKSKDEVDGRAFDFPVEFLLAFGALRNVTHERLNLRSEVIVGATYRGNHGISYRVDKLTQSAEGWEKTGKLTPGVDYTQLDDGGYPAGTEWRRSQQEFLHGTEEIDGQHVPIFTLSRMPLTTENLRVIVPGR